MSDTPIKVENVSKKFCRSLKRSLWYGMNDLGNEFLGRRHGSEGQLRAEEFWAIKNVSFEVKRGECLGLVGRNGAGKTTLLRILNGLIKPDGGRVEMRGRVGALIALGAGFNPILSGRENVYVNGSVLGLSKGAIDRQLDEIIDFAEIGDFIDAPVQSYSSGMQVRLGFAVATVLKPDILILDEVLAVGDTAFRAKCFERIGKMLTGTSVIFVSHDEAQVRRICDQVLLLRRGQKIFFGDTDVGLRLYRSEAGAAAPRQEIISSALSNIQLSILTPDVPWGGDLVFELRFRAIDTLPVGFFLVHFFCGGTFVSHADLSSNRVIISSGLNRWRITIKTLQLVADSYFLSVTLFSEDRRKTIMHLINAASFQMLGSRGHGPSVLQPAALEIAPV